LEGVARYSKISEKSNKEAGAKKKYRQPQVQGQGSGGGNPGPTMFFGKKRRPGKVARKRRKDSRLHPKRWINVGKKTLKKIETSPQSRGDQMWEME